MDRRTIVATLALGPLVLSGCATSASAVAEAPAAPDIVTSDLSDLPETGDAGPYVVLIPTSTDARPAPELTAALQNLADAMARRRGAGASHVAYVADPASGEFDAASTMRAIEALNQAQGFSLTASGGAILVIAPTHPTRSTAQDAAAWVFASNDPAQLAQSIVSAVRRADRHDVPSGVPSQPNPFGGVSWLIGLIFPDAEPKPPAPRP